jgi:hypothetical protein
MEDNLSVLEFSLTDEQLNRLDQLSDFRPGFPLGFLTSDHVRQLIFGQTFDLIDQPLSVV